MVKIKRLITSLFSQKDEKCVTIGVTKTRRCVSQSVAVGAVEMRFPWLVRFFAATARSET